MTLTTGKNSALLGIVAFCLSLATISLTNAQTTTSPDASALRPTEGIPAPVVVFMGPEFFETAGKQFVRYRFEISNFKAYPNALFETAPKLPPCGANTNSSRTWVDLYNQNGKRLFGFCALAKPADLEKIWFALESTEVPPSWIYVELTDRSTNTKYKSSLVETTQ